MKRTRNNLVLGLMLVASASAAAFVIGDLAACVPSSEEVYPRGAVNVVLTPSRATLGEPFTTADGWTIRVSAFVVQALIAGQGPPPDLLTNGAVHLFHATRRQEFLIPRIDEG